MSNDNITISLQMPRELKNKVVFYAAQHGLCQSAMIRQLLTEWIRCKDVEMGQPVVSKYKSKKK